jgi:glycerol uptake facilitator protein
MNAPLAELVGTAILVLLGNGVVANVVLKDTKGHASGWIVITAGWALAVAVAVYCTTSISGAHLNPAVTLGMAVIGKFAWADVPSYVLAQIAGAFVGAVLVWLAYLPHWKVTPDAGTKLAAYSTSPAIRHSASNLICEIIGTALLVLGVLAITAPANLIVGSGFDKGFAPALVGLLVGSIGLSLGGPTGYAINPARDLGPRLAHWVLPIAGKGGSDWGYAWIPIVGPLIGGVIGGLLYVLFWGSPVA